MAFPVLDPFRPEYITKTFTEVWNNYDSFKQEYDELMPLVSGGITPLNEDNVKATFYLLYAR